MRIVAGAYKGRKLLSPPAGAQTRPITGLAKKSLFDTLGPRLADAAVVDLYCGTGSMGLEALSRGAEACWFAEKDRRVLERLRRNIEAVGAEGCCTVWPGDVSRRLDERLAAVGRAVDVAFVDPPYAAARAWSWARAERAVFAPLAGRLAADGVAVVRVPADAVPPAWPADLTETARKTFGEMVIAILGRSTKARQG